MDSKSDGSNGKAGPFASSSTKTAGVQSRSGVGGTANATLVRKISGGIKVSTVKRVAVPSRASPLSLSTLPPSSAPRINGLSEEKRQRVEEIRRERERKQREEEERLRPAKVKSATSAAPVKRRKVIKDDSDNDDLFSTGSETSSKKRKKEKKSSSIPRPENVGQGYKKLGRSDVLPLYLVPRPLHDEEAFSSDTSARDRAIQSVSLVEGKQYGPCECPAHEESCNVTDTFLHSLCRLGR
jgi:hypothetical protein